VSESKADQFVPANYYQGIRVLLIGMGGVLLVIWALPQCPKALPARAGRLERGEKHLF